MGAQQGQKYFSGLLEVELKGFVNCSRWLLRSKLVHLVE